ncbi:MAG: 4Fe-4S dicluster domain-containing protein [Candidatus Helarchaeota archaeon]|nr:4Fe-4S dicluster domain-containing protein [Candidatus Helarchaeota archaeon]
MKDIKIEFKKPIKSSELDPEFKYAVANTYEGRTILYCYQCGTCSAGCPVLSALELMPHQVIRMTLLGLKKEVLETSTLWLCATCYLCNERCPQGVEISNVFFALKNIAVQNRIIPRGLKQLAKNIYKLGVSAEMTEFQEEEREDLGLPEVPVVDSSAVQEILKRTGLCKLLKEEKQSKEDVK